MSAAVGAAVVRGGRAGPRGGGLAVSARNFSAMERRLVAAARRAGWRGADLRAQVMPRSTFEWTARVAVGSQTTGGVREESAAAESPEDAVEALIARIGGAL